jgi:uncharacterized protein with FMN-binding domain
VRRIVPAVASTITAVVLLFSYHTSTGSGSSPTATSMTRPASQQAASGSAGGGKGGSTSTSGTYTGDEVSTEWGIVQVEVIVQGGKITSANAVQVPDGNHRDQEINAYAVPVLNQEVLAAQDAGIDTVSGATVTSDGYIQSLQSALDAAHRS